MAVMAECNDGEPSSGAGESSSRQLVAYSDSPRGDVGGPDPLQGFVDEHGDVDTSCFLDREEQGSPQAFEGRMSPITAPWGI